MPRIPFASTDTPAGTIQVGLPDDYQRISADPSAFGGNIGQADQRLGAGAEQAGGVALDVATRQRQLYDQAAVQGAFTQLRDTIIRASYGDPSDPNSSPGFLAKTGADAMSGVDGAISDISSARDSIRQGLSSPAQQRLFDRQAAGLIADTNAKYLGHAAEQKQTWLNQTADAGARSAQSAAIAAPPDTPEFLNHLADGANDIITKGSRLGWSPDVINDQVAQYKSGTFRGQVERLQAVNPLAAQSYYNTHRNQLTGPDQLSVETRLRPAVLAWGSRDTAQGIIAGNSGAAGSAPMAGPIMQAAQQQGVGATLALTSAALESNLGQAPDRPGSQYQGPFQMGDAAWAARGGTAANRNDPIAQVQLGVANLKHSQDVASQALGRPATDAEAYLTHQQGDAGGPALLTANPSTPAVQALAPAYGGNTAAAQAAIVNNGGNASMSAGQFVNMWRDKCAAKEASFLQPGPSVGTAAPLQRTPMVFGDSLAVGAASANGYSGSGKVGAHTDQVLDQINALPPNGIPAGTPVVLSSGISNDIDNPLAHIDTVQQQIDSLHARGVTDIRIVGVGANPKLAGVNDALQQLAQKNGATFTGPIQSGPDGIHPTTAAGYKGLGANPPPGPQLAGVQALRPNPPAMLDQYRMSPAADAIIKAGHAGKDAARALGLMDGEVSDRWVRHAIETPGYFLGLPTGQAAGAGQFLWDAWNGDEAPQSAADWLRGIMYGPAPRTAAN